jgi:hypothetical protein
MRDWIADCTWREDAETLADLPASAVYRGIERHYAGGVAQFRRDGAAAQHAALSAR